MGTAANYGNRCYHYPGCLSKFTKFVISNRSKRTGQVFMFFVEDLVCQTFISTFQKRMERLQRILHGG